MSAERTYISKDIKKQENFFCACVILCIALLSVCIWYTPFAGNL